jgi:two-component system, NarL family, sensor histidine kinase DesK
MPPLSECIISTKKLPATTRDRKWIPIIWLPYFLFFLLQPAFDHASGRVWLINGLGGAVFLVFYFGMFWSSKPRRAWVYMAGIVLLGMLLAPINGGAATFFIYATAFCPFLAETEVGAIKAMAVVVGLACLETVVMHLHWSFLIYAGAFAAVIGAGNIFFAQRNRANLKLRIANEEIEHLAKVAERERIARDMHDILGHTLSIIILKSELAGKLIDIDPERAKNEIRDVEQTSRQALSDVRHAIRGYRSQSLEAELKHAKATLETAGLSVKSEASEVNLTPAQESVVALVIREAVTNVVRHSQARNCSLRMSPVNGSCLLEIADDGRGSVEAEGSGLRGMRERILALGGTLERETQAGTKLTIQFPLSQPNGKH